MTKHAAFALKQGTEVLLKNANTGEPLYRATSMIEAFGWCKANGYYIHSVMAA